MRVPNPRQQLRNWVFTINNPTEADETILLSFLSEPGAMAEFKIRYITWTSEISASGTPHYQGYLELLVPKRRRQVLRFLPKAHLEQRMGTQAEAIAYVWKMDSTFDADGFHGMAGTAAKQIGDDIVDAIHGGATATEIAEEFPKQYMRMHSGIDKMIGLKVKPRSWKMQVDIYYGKTGTGKSWSAHELHPGAYYWEWPTGGRWWAPGYNGQEVIVMDEFRHQIKLSVLLKVLDRYPFTMESKGSNREMTSKKIVITTNREPMDWYPNKSGEEVAPLHRRFRDFATIYDFAEPTAHTGRDMLFTDINKVIRTEVVTRSVGPDGDNGWRD